MVQYNFGASVSLHYKQRHKTHYISFSTFGMLEQRKCHCWEESSCPFKYTSVYFVSATVIQLLGWLCVIYQRIVQEKIDPEDAVLYQMK